MPKVLFKKESKLFNERAYKSLDVLVKDQIKPIWGQEIAKSLGLRFDSIRESLEKMCQVGYVKRKKFLTERNRIFYQATDAGLSAIKAVRT